MKKRMLALLLSALLLSAAACAETAAEITAQTLSDATNIMTILGQYGAFAVDYADGEILERYVYAIEDGNLLFSDTYTESETNETMTNCVVGNELAFYFSDPTGAVRSAMLEEDVQDTFAGSLLELEGEKFTVEEEENAYCLRIASEQTEMRLDKETLLPQTITWTANDDAEDASLAIETYSYGEGIVPDLTAAEAYAAQPKEPEITMLFATQDLDGNTVTLSDFADASVIMVNLWEPWCNPCVKEMPELEKLYQKYKDDGFVLLGAFSETDMDDDVRAVIENTGVTYPIVRADSLLNSQQTGYVPTTFFMDASGKVLSEDPYVGGASFEEWEKILLIYLGQ